MSAPAPLRIESLFSQAAIDRARQHPLEVQFQCHIDVTIQAFERRILWYGVIARHLQNAHGPLRLERLKFASVADDQSLSLAVWDLENAVEHELPAARIGIACGAPAFLVDIGPVDVAFLRDGRTFIDEPRSDRPTADAIWNFASMLADTDYLARLKSLSAEDAWLWNTETKSATSRFFAMSCDVLAAYWRGRLGHVDAMTTKEPEVALRQAFERDPDVLDIASAEYLRSPDLEILEFKMRTATSNLFGAMAQATGYLDAAAGTTPPGFAALWKQATSLGLAGTWTEVGRACRALFADRNAWRRAADLTTIGTIGQAFLAQHGLSYAPHEGNARTRFSLPSRPALH